MISSFSSYSVFLSLFLFSLFLLHIHGKTRVELKIRPRMRVVGDSYESAIVTYVPRTNLASVQNDGVVGMVERSGGDYYFPNISLRVKEPSGNHVTDDRTGESLVPCSNQKESHKSVNLSPLLDQDSATVEGPLPMSHLDLKGKLHWEGIFLLPNCLCDILVTD